MSFSLQANWHNQSFYLWATNTDGLPLHDAAALRAAVGDACSDGLLASVAAEGSFAIHLPDAHGITAPVEVPALILRPADAIDFLTCLPAQTPPHCAPSVDYWKRLGQLVLRLIAAKQFVPRVDEASDGVPIASWRVVMADRTQTYWLDQFVSAMPPVCRAAVAPSPEETQAALLVETFLAATTDAIIRRAVAEDEFFQNVHTRAAKPDATPEIRWVSALLGPNRAMRNPEDDEDGGDASLAFIQQAQAWLGQLDEAQAAALRLCFVLHEPQFPDEDPADLEAELIDSETDTEEREAHLSESAPTESASTESASTEPTVPEIPTSDPSPQSAHTNGSIHPANDVSESVPVSPLIVSPPPEAETWTITLHLQGLDGDGELIDAAALWEAASRAAVISQTLAKRQAALLGELARAADVFPPAQILLAHPEPSQLVISTTDAYAFIRHWAPLLRDRGFGIELPDWASGPEEEVGLRLVLSPTDDLDDLFDPFNNNAPANAAKARSGQIGEAIEFSTGQFGLDSLMNFDWQIAIGTLRLSASEFERLAAQNVPLVRHNGRWIHLDLEATRKAVEFVKKKQGGQITLAEAFRTAFTAQKSETGLAVIGLTGTSWLEQLLEQSPGAAIEQIGQPKTFGGDLRPYQLRGLHWLTFLDRLGLGACLADDMGLGKTIQLIALLLHERERYINVPPPTQNIQALHEPHAENASTQSASIGVTSLLAPPTVHPRRLPGPTLLFAPTSVVGNWLREVERFAKALRIMIHHGPERLSGDAFVNAAYTYDIIVTSYSLAHRDKDDLGKVRWHRIALDEAQKIKNPAAASTVAIRGLYAPHRVALTGTPIENHLSELWSIMQVLNPGLLGTAGDFREKFAVPIEKLGEKDRADQLRKMIRPFVLRRTKQDPTIAGDLPAKIEQKVFCNLTAEQASMYERLVNDSLRQIDSASGIRRRGLILATLTRLKQICNHPGLLETNPTALDHRSGKCERLVDMLEELLEEGDACLIFTQYREMGHILERLIKARLNEPTFFLHGGTPAKGRDDLIQRFQEQQGAPRIFLLSLRAGGLGLNLTAANHVFHFDRWWNPAVEAQATDRAHRVGQTRTVQVHKFVCIGTMEERIDRLLSEKQALADQIVGSGDEWLTGLSTDQLRDYLSLSQEAIGEFE